MKAKTKSNSYPSEIINSASQFGFKAANLLYLKEKLAHFDAADSKISISVPNIAPISHKMIADHLDQYAPEFKSLWAVFVKTFNSQSQSQTIEGPALATLAELQTTIKEAFVKSPLDTTALTSSLKQGGLLMIRSTGKEDSTEMANPGGNTSLPSKFEAQSISEAIGEVASSYVAPKSLLQRLKAKDDITKDPFFPVLIQNLIGEGLGENNDLVYSGVMYSGNDATRLQIAPGHGELVVNSKGNTDNYYVTNHNMIYTEVQDKPFRIKSKYDEVTGKLSLEEADNSKSVKKAASLTPEVAHYMHNLAQYIEGIYEMRMDVEFVYSPQEKTVYVVQARPIPMGDRVDVAPCALDPIYVNKIKEDGGKAFKGSTITPEVKAAVVISCEKEICVTDNIEFALSQFLHNPNKAITAVVVKNKAPDTSHEAGEFSSKNIPVVQISNIAEIENLLKDLKAGNKIIVDPQRKSVYQLPDKYSLAANLIEAGVIKEGLFKSALTPNVSIFEYNFPKIEDAAAPNENRELSEKLGALIIKAKGGDTGATQELFEFLGQKLFNDSRLAPASLENLNNHLELLSNPYSDVGYDDHTKALKSSLNTIAKLHQAKLIPYNLFVQNVIACAELKLLIEEIDAKAGHVPDTLYEQYLNVYEKFQGIITAYPEKDILSESVVTHLAEKHHEKKVVKHIAEDEVPEAQREYFTQLTKLGQFFINKDSSANWIKFCKEICQNGLNAARLSTIVEKIVEADIHAQWCNISFSKKYKESNGDSKKVLISLIKEASTLVQDQSSAETDRLITQIKKQVPNWREEANFEKLFQDWSSKVKRITEKLKFDPKMPEVSQMLLFKQMHDFVDSMDLTIKSLENSTLYDDKVLQARNFQKVLTPFFDVMQEWISKIELNNKMVTLAMSKKLHTESLSEGDLSPSGEFCVNSATSDHLYHLGERGLGRTLTKCNNLADLFTWIHQNLLMAMGRMSKDVNENLKSEYPQFIQEIINLIPKQFEINKESNYRMPVNFHLLATEFNYPGLELHYNIPLRDHSARFDLKYDCKTGETKLVFYAFGVNEQSRWNTAELETNIALQLFSDIKINTFPIYSENKNTFTFEVNIEKIEDIDKVVDCIGQVCETSLIITGKYGIVKSNYKSLKAVPTEKLEHFVKFCEEIINNNPTGADNLKAEIYLIKYILESNKKDFNLIDFCIRHPQSIADFIEWAKKKKELANAIIKTEDIEAISHLIEAIQYKDEFKNDESITINTLQTLVHKDPNLNTYTQVKSILGSLAPIHDPYVLLEKEELFKFHINSKEEWAEISRLIDNPTYGKRIIDMIFRQSDQDSLKIISEIEHGFDSDHQHVEFLGQVDTTIMAG